MKGISLAIVTMTIISQIAAAPPPLPRYQSRQIGTSDTENDLVDGNGCKEVLIIFARGTTESGNVGTLVGPPFFSAVAADIGSTNLALQGVDYPASIQGFLEGGDPTGSATMSSLVEQAASECNGTKIVMSGYSQGGQLVHNSAKNLSAAAIAAVNSVVIFGDPDNGTAVGSFPPSEVLVICHTGDDICEHGDLILPAHLDYSENATEAAAFVQERAGL